jgi:hypothetical protein
MVILAQVIKTDLSSSVVDLWHYRKIGHWKLLTLGIFFREGIQEWESHRTSACRHGSCLCTCSKIKLKIREKEVTDKHKYKFYSTLYIPLLVRYLPGHVLPPPHPPCTEEIWSPKNGAEAQYCTVAIVGHLEWVVLWIRKNVFLLEPDSKHDKNFRSNRIWIHITDYKYRCKTNKVILTW